MSKRIAGIGGASLRRRQVLGGTMAAGLGGAAWLTAGCGDDDDAPAPTGSGSPAATSGAGGGTSGSPSPAANRPRLGGEMRLPGIDRVTDFDPHRSLLYAAVGVGLAMDQPIGLNKDFGLVPELVKSWEVIGSGEQYILTVQPEAKWQNRPPVNGRPVDAQDIAYNFMRIAAKLPGDKAGERPRAGSLLGMERAEAVDKDRVRITMSKPNSSFLVGVTDPRNRMIPREMPDQLNFDDPKKAVGSGPYVVQTFESGVEATFTKNPDYWKKDAAGQSVPYLDSIRIRWAADSTALLAAFLSNQLHYRVIASPEELATVKKSRSDAPILRQLQGTRDQWRFNTKRKPFDDPRIWKALGLALDYADLNNSYLGEGNWEYIAILPVPFPGSLPHAEAKKLPGLNPDTKQKDIQDAKQLMSAAGFPNGNLSFSILVYPAPDSFLTNAVNIQAQMKKIWPAIDIKIDKAPDAATFTNRQAQANFDSTSYAIAPSADPALELISAYATTGARNYGGYSNKQVDEVLDRALLENDARKRADLIGQAQKLILDTGNPTIWLQQPYRSHAFDPKIRGVVEDEIRSFATGAGNPAGLPLGLSRQLWLSA